jgi:2-methylisocitrate lyase-like PEP mutase family enzyme
MLSDPAKFIVCPGVYDGYTARIALQEGADCLYMVRILNLETFLFTTY